MSPSLLVDPSPRVIACVGAAGVVKTTTSVELGLRARLDPQTAIVVQAR